MSEQEKDKTVHKNNVIESESDWQINLRTFWEGGTRMKIFETGNHLELYIRY